MVSAFCRVSPVKPRARDFYVPNSEALAPDEMLEKPISGREIDFEDWRLLGIEVVEIAR